MIDFYHKPTEWTKTAVRICLAILIIGLAACYDEIHEKTSPLTSGALWYQSQNGSSIEKELSSDQLRRLSVWLEKRRDDWTPCVHARQPWRSFTISLMHANGKSSLFVAREHELEAVHVEGGNQSNEACALLSVTERDMAGLRSILPFEETLELNPDGLPRKY